MYIGGHPHLSRSGHAPRGFRNRSRELPISRTIIFPPWRVRRIPRISGIAGRKVPRGRTVIGRATVHVRIRGRIVAAVRIIITTPRRRVVVNRSATRRRSVAGPVVVVVTARAPLAVSIAVGVPTWAETARGWSASVPVITRRVRTASTRRARSGACVPRNVRLSLRRQVSERHKTRG